MATVFVTKDLRSRVHNRIGNMRDRELQTLCPKIGTNISLDASYLFNLASWGKEHYHLLRLTPKDWLYAPENVSLYILDDATKQKCRMRFVGVTDARPRPSNNRYSYDESTIRIEDLRALPEETVGRTEALEYWDSFIEHCDITQRWEKIRTDVDNFLQKCKSVNEGVKLFPNIRMYLHSEDIERLDKPVVRKASERQDIVADLDVSELTAAAMSAKLMGGI